MKTKRACRVVRTHGLHQGILHRLEAIDDFLANQTRSMRSVRLRSVPSREGIEEEPATGRGSRVAGRNSTANMLLAE